MVANRALHVLANFIWGNMIGVTAPTVSIPTGFVADNRSRLERMDGTG
jgi:hypothetical protein